jgi:hypothetical protein
MTITLLGAGGKMGMRCTNNLLKTSHNSRFVEIDTAGQKRIQEAGGEVWELSKALKGTQAVIFAVPDKAIKTLSETVIPLLDPGTIVMILDPAAPLGGDLPERKDITYFVCHPCHPPLINDETDPEARRDFYGGIKARQNIVCALMQGPEEHYALGEEVARDIFAPVMRSHRITVEQMAVLEPAMAETVVLTLMFTIRESLDEAIKAGVPEEAARDFLMGHMNVNVGILFDYLGVNFSDGALKAVERGKKAILKENWRDAFKRESIMKEIKAITGREES